jgi:hypothetical protein
MTRAENLDPGVSVMQSTNQGMRHDAPDSLNRARDWRILVPYGYHEDRTPTHGYEPAREAVAISARP